MSKKRLTKRRSEAIRILLDRWYMSYDRIGSYGRYEIFGVPLSQINVESIHDLYIENIKSEAEIGDWFEEDLNEAIRNAEELYQNTLDD